MTVGDSIQNGINTVVTEVSGFVASNPLASAGVAAGVGAVIGAGAIGIVTSPNGTRKKTRNKKKRKNKKITHTRRGLIQDRRRKSKQKWEVAYRKRKKNKNSRSRKGVKYTKNGQPYILKANGQARFIKGKRRAK